LKREIANLVKGLNMWEKKSHAHTHTGREVVSMRKQTTQFARSREGCDVAIIIKKEKQKQWERKCNHNKTEQKERERRKGNQRVNETKKQQQHTSEAFEINSRRKISLLE
jgi:hypothetical protein